MKKSGREMKEDMGKWKRKRIVISIKVVGSTGAIRFMVNEDDLVYDVIQTALKFYALQARFPPLPFLPNNFFLYCLDLSHPDGHALSPGERIGLKEGRKFVLCKKTSPNDQKIRSKKEEYAAKGGSCWKKWLKNSLRFKMIRSH